MNYYAVTKYPQYVYWVYLIINELERQKFCKILQIPSITYNNYLVILEGLHSHPIIFKFQQMLYLHITKTQSKLGYKILSLKLERDSRNISHRYYTRRENDI